MIHAVCLGVRFFDVFGLLDGILADDLNPGGNNLVTYPADREV